MYVLSYIIVRGHLAGYFLSTYIMYPMRVYTTSVTFKNAVLQYTYLTAHIVFYMSHNSPLCH